MYNKLTVYFRRNPGFSKYNDYISVIVDGLEIGQMEPGEKDFLITDGIHTLDIVLHTLHTEVYDSSIPGGGTHHYCFETQQIEVSNKNIEITLNLYFYNATDIEFGFGNIPYSAERAKPKKGCYVATAVYGSYNCPEVWTLRRYRDYSLAKTWYGRSFIRIYYAISPTLVKWFGNVKWFKCIFKKKLDKMVKKLNSQGIENTPYND